MSIARLLGIALLLCARLAWGVPDVLLDRPEVPLGDSLEILDDPTGAFTRTDLSEPQISTRFHKPPTAIPNLGYRAGATWVRFRLASPGDGGHEFWLSINSIYQSSYILHLIDDRGRVETQETGAQVAVERRPLASRTMILPIHLEPRETKTAYLRIAGHAPTVIDLKVWAPAAYTDHLTRQATVKYLSLGATSIIIIFSILAFRARQALGLLAIIPGHLLTLGVVLWGDGFGAAWIPDGDAAWYKNTQMLLIGLAIVCHMLFARDFLMLRQFAPVWDKVLQWLAAGFFVLVLWVRWRGDFLVLATVAQIAMTALLSVVAGWVAKRRGAPGVSYLAAWGTLWGTFIFRQAQSLGLLSGTESFGQSWLAGLFVASLALSYALFLEVAAARSEVQRKHAQLLAVELNQSARLARAVAERTEELRLAKARAEEANRSKSLFLSMVSHEFRTPLHNILGFTHILSRRGDAGLADALAVIERSGEQLLGLIDEVLNFTHGETQEISLQASPIHLPSLLNYLGEIGRLRAERNGNRFLITRDFRLPDAVLADEQRLLRVLTNLIDNACKYTRGGAVTLEVRTVATPTAGDASARRWCLLFAVSDDGAGIAEAEKGRIFEAFNRGSASSVQPGMGLGLAIALQYVQAMGGEITVESREGQGSRFSFQLDFQETDAEKPKAFTLRKQIIGYEGQRKRLLVVDDMAENRLYLSTLLESWGFAITTAADGREALSQCQAQHRPDAVLVDQFMPVADGWAFLQGIREMYSKEELPVVLVSAAPPEPGGVKAGLAFDAVLIKPVTAQSLTDVIGPLLGLEWRFDEAGTDRAEVGITYPRLPENQLADFCSMVDLGRIAALERWAETLSASNAEYRPFAAEVLRLCRAVNLQGLRRLSARIA